MQKLNCFGTGTHTHTQLFYGSMDFVRYNPVKPVPEEIFTHSNLSWSSIIPYLLHPSTVIHGILPVQSTHLTVFFHNLSPSFLWSLSWAVTLHFILHTFLHPIIVNHCLLFATHAHTISACLAVVPRLCHLPGNPKLFLNFLLRILSCSFTPHIHDPSNHSHLCPLLWHWNSHLNF